MSLKTDYIKYLNSNTWKKLRKKAYKRANGKCELCEETAECVHHIKYPKNLSKDNLNNLLVCCHNCHDKQHGIFDGGESLLRKTISTRINLKETGIKSCPYIYQRFDMSATHDTSGDVKEEARVIHFDFFMKNFSDYMPNKFSLDNFQLRFWKGTGWWGSEDFNVQEKEFGGWSSLEIILWIIQNYGKYSRVENQEWFKKGKEEYEKSHSI